MNVVEKNSEIRFASRFGHDLFRYYVPGTSIYSSGTYLSGCRAEERSGRMFLKRQRVRSFGNEAPSLSVLAMRLLDRYSLCRFGQARPWSEVMALKLTFTSTRLIRGSKLSTSRRELLERDRTFISINRAEVVGEV